MFGTLCTFLGLILQPDPVQLLIAFGS